MPGVRPILDQSLFIRITVTNFLFFGALNLYILLPLHIKGIGGTEVEVGVVMALYSASGIVCQPIIGVWIHAFGRRRLMLYGVALLVATGLLAAGTQSIWLLAAVRVVHGVAFSAFFVANYTMVLDMVPVERRGWALGIYGVSGLAATALAPLVGEAVVRHLGFRALFLSSALLAAATAASVWLITEPRPAPRGTPFVALPSAREIIDEILRLHMALGFFFGLGTGVVFAFMPTYAATLGVGSLALFYTGYAGAAMLVRIAGGQLIDTRGRRAVIVPSMFVQACAAAILAVIGIADALSDWTPALPFLVLAGVISGGAHGFLYPALAALVTDITPDVRRGVVVGLFSSVFLTGNALGTFAFGFAAHGLGYAAMWTILALILGVGFLLSVKLEAAAPQPLTTETEVTS